MHTVFFSRNDSNSAMSHRDQILHQLPGSLLIGYHHRRNPFLRRITVSYHHWHRKLLWQNVNQPLMSGYINNPFHLFGQKLVYFSLYNSSISVTLIVGILKFFIKSQIHQQNLIIFFLTVLCDAINDIWQGKNRHIFCNHSDTPAILCFQILCHRIRGIIHLFDHFLYPDSRFFTDLSFLVDDIRDSCYGYSAYLSYFLYRRHPAFSLSLFTFA